MQSSQLKVGQTKNNANSKEKQLDKVWGTWKQPLFQCGLVRIKSKQRNGFDDQEDETRFQSGPASFLHVVIKQVREAATVIPESNPIGTLKLANNIVEMSNTLEYYMLKRKLRRKNRPQQSTQELFVFVRNWKLENWKMLRSEI